MIDKFIIYPSTFSGAWLRMELLLYDMRFREQVKDDWDDEVVAKVVRTAAPMGERIREFGMWKRMTWDFRNF